MKKMWDQLSSTSKMVLGAGSFLAALYVGLSPRVAAPIYNKMMFHPHRFPEGSYDLNEIAGIKRQDIYFPSSDGLTLHGWYFENPQASTTLLFSHGNTGNLASRPHILELALRCGVSMFVYDYRGYGRSQGQPSVRGICDDGIAAHDHLVRQLGVDASQLLLYGESLGASVSCQIAAVRDVAGLVLQSGFASIRKIGTEMMPFMSVYPGFLFPRPELNNLKFVAGEHPPLLILHGEGDSVIPFSHAQLLYDRASEPKQLVGIPGAAHNDICFVDPQMYINAMKQFIAGLSENTQTYFAPDAGGTGKRVVLSKDSIKPGQFGQSSLILPSD